MSNYYFLTTLLPPLKIGSPPEISSRELTFLLRQNVGEKDFSPIIALRELVDIENIRALWLRLPAYSQSGNYDEQELEENIMLKQNLPPYVLEYLEKYSDTKERLDHFSELLHQFFQVSVEQQSGFLKEYLQFEWEWRLVFVALRAKELGRNLTVEMQYENPENPFVAEIIAQTAGPNENKSFHPPAPYEALKALFDARKHAPLELYQAVSEWRFDQIEEKIEWDNFSINRILGYLAQLEIVEQWLELDKRKGLEIVNQMMETQTA